MLRLHIQIELFLDASGCSIWRRMNSCTQTENQRRRLPDDEEVPPQGHCSGKGHGGTCWPSHGWLYQSLVQRGVRQRKQLKDIHFHDCLKVAFPKKANKMLEEQSIQYLCSISGNLFWSIILCCNGRFVNNKCRLNTHINLRTIFATERHKIFTSTAFFVLCDVLFQHTSQFIAQSTKLIILLSILHNLYSACLLAFQRIYLFVPPIKHFINEYFNFLINILWNIVDHICSVQWRRILHWWGIVG